MNDREKGVYFESKMQEAILLKRKGEYTKSIFVYQQMINTLGDIPHIYEGLAKVLAVSGNYDDAIKSFEIAAVLYKQLIALNPNDKTHVEFCKNKAMLCDYSYKYLTNNDRKTSAYKAFVADWRGND